MMKQMRKFPLCEGWLMITPLPSLKYHYWKELSCRSEPFPQLIYYYWSGSVWRDPWWRAVRGGRCGQSWWRGPGAGTTTDTRLMSVMPTRWVNNTRHPDIWTIRDKPLPRFSTDTECPMRIWSWWCTMISLTVLITHIKEKFTTSQEGRMCMLESRKVQNIHMYFPS